MMGANIATTPLDPSLPLFKAESDDKPANLQEYQELLGSLKHAAIFSAPRHLLLSLSALSVSHNPHDNTYDSGQTSPTPPESNQRHLRFL